MGMTPIKQKITLAIDFSDGLKACLTAAQMRECVDRNKAEPVDSDVCHSHDYCDANMVMFEAFQSTFGREPDTDNGPDLELWNDAWEIAKAASFF
jgi:hypothetical protein